MTRTPDLQERIAIHKEVVDLLNKKDVDLVSAYEILTNILVTIEKQLKEAGYVAVPAMEIDKNTKQVKN